MTSSFEMRSSVGIIYIFGISFPVVIDVPLCRKGLFEEIVWPISHRIPETMFPSVVVNGVPNRRTFSSNRGKFSSESTNILTQLLTTGHQCQTPERHRSHTQLSISPMMYLALNSSCLQIRYVSLTCVSDHQTKVGVLPLTSILCTYIHTARFIDAADRCGQDTRMNPLNESTIFRYRSAHRLLRTFLVAKI